MINPNSAFEEELYFDYLKDPQSVSSEWREYFDKIHGKSVQPYNPSGEMIEPGKPEPKQLQDSTFSIMQGETLEQMASIQQKIAENMEGSINVPTATSVRAMPVKPLDENRRLINKYLLKLKRNKISFTHILAWAIVKTLMRFPQLNDAYARKDGKSYRIKRNDINFGLAVDITRKDGTRLLLVPNIKHAQKYHFSEFIEKFDELIYKARNNKLEVDDFAGTSVTLTNPGMIGTSFSNPRLMEGQGLIIATGSIDYPTEFQAVSNEILTTLAISKVVTISNTYDHRIIQGAESAEFLKYMNQLLLGEERFYDQMFSALKVPFEPIRWETDRSNLNPIGQFDVKEMIEKSAHVMLLINAYRVRGHLVSSTNPLGLSSYYYPELNPSYYGFNIWDLDRRLHTDDSWDKDYMPLREIIELLRETYCGPIGIEFMHIQDPEKKEWIKSTLEKTRNTIDYTKEEKLHIFDKLVNAEEFENFLHTKFVGYKRFSLEGSEAVIVLIDKIFDNAADSSLDTIVLGMAHRGRLNVLVNILKKDLAKIFDEFDEAIDPIHYEGSGDVKYHLGAKGTFVSLNNNKVKVILSPNPSHLELVDPVIEGMARATSNKIQDKHYENVLPILVHGDAAFAGQGIVAETLNLSNLEGYKTGGTIHIIINNQIGFTTNIEDARSTIYATDIAKMIQVPIIHVNGNDPEAVVTAAAFAYQYRKKFQSDVIIDMLSYRKYGHNEADEPTYTQPLLYKKIKKIDPVATIYKDQLLKEKIVNEEEAVDHYRKTQEKLYEVFQKRDRTQKAFSVGISYKHGEIFNHFPTAISNEVLKEITHGITSLPHENLFKANPKVKQLLEKRLKMVESSKPAIDWAMAEALSFGSILLDGKEIRFSGQDSRRGTFSQRHAVLTDIKTEENYVPLNNIRNDQARIRIFDSPLSEMAVLGYEYGYSVIANDSLTLWEAQFGDFANNAVSIVDQFMSCAETKWGQTSNLVMLLPHSYDGQGSEHSSARLERYLQLCAEENMIVANLTTPAQYFHILRRQTVMPFRKPMILMTPKSMLRHPMAVSSAKDLTDDGFHEILDTEVIMHPSKVKRVLLCTGKLYYELKHYMEAEKIENVAIIRIEQIYPLHEEKLTDALSKYSNTKEVVWVQEEPQNQGAWMHLRFSLSQLLSNSQTLSYAGRPESAATATGSLKIHNETQKRLIRMAFDGV
jgi:2-oxoglutarate decarboxylase